MILKELQKEALSDSFVKVVVDIERRILSFGCELHIDCAEELLKDGSANAALWGANVYPKTGKIDFVSLINVRPQDGNRTMEITLSNIRTAVEKVIRSLLLFS